MGCIYKITNTVTNKVYIGVTLRDPHIRWLEHQSRARYTHHTSAFHSAIRKYGAESFVLSILEESHDTEYLYKIAESHWITEYNSIAPNGYNLTSGGDARTMSDQLRAKISLAKMGHIVTESTRAKLSDYNNLQWLVTYTDGKVEQVHNLKQFCRTLNINYGRLCKSKRHKRAGIKELKKIS